MSTLETDGLSVTHSSDRSGSPDLRLIHYNDVYHVEEGSAEPVGGVSRFQSLVNYYRSHAHFAGQPDILTFFSGDAFNPSIESTITKGRHMVPFLNTVGTDVACVGNHDLDFGVAQFRHLASQCHFPWLLANVLDPSLGDDIPIADCGKTRMLTSSNGLKIGVLGLGEREWLDTINALPPDLIYQSASQTAQKLAKQLREGGADLVVAVTHQREPNDYKLAENLTPALVDIILGGHDHFYAHAVVNGIHVIRSGTDFKQLSYIEAFRKPNGLPGWDFNITRRDVVRSIPEDPDTVAMVARLGASLKAKLDKPIGFTVSPLDGRFSTVRQRESNLGNFVCDLMRFYYAADCAMMAGGTIRGDQIYPPGILKLKDLLNCFPFEDPVVLLRVRGHALLAALENGVSQLPALEGRFSQVSNISYGFKLEAPSGSRITFARVGGQPLDLERDYVVATRGYMARGKDGFTSLLIEAEGGEVEELVSEENGVLISTILRQYFLSLKVLGKWNRWSASLRRHWGTVHRNLHGEGWLKPPSATTSPKSEKKAPGKRLERPTLQRTSRAAYYYGRFPEEVESQSQDTTEVETNGNAMDSDSDEDPDILTSSRPTTNYVTQPARSSAEEEHRLQIARRVVRKWMRHAGLQSNSLNTMDGEGEFTPAWTSGISPRLEGRIVQE
ncbi:5'-Nucleotidase/apyrase [Penicillium brevicompactum]|uniref:5'-Nucleotidase/apyrase n=1 Tax=Penicillium brevicompactum TaxID=5074 RepID=UPI0025405084|nr:5'-Nucleotidase/apyrase [Penicillium brevicompactum]KAJ5321644.1 5'-Nucleotidase/apyrase [Penicillium brevicompactum]